MEHEDTKTIVSRVTDYGPKPRSARQALIQAHAFLAEEGQWISGSFFRDGDPEEAYEAAACNSWSACAMGALGLVTGEMKISVTKEWVEFDDFEMRGQWINAVVDGVTELGFAQWLETADRVDPLSITHYFNDVDGGEVFNKDTKPVSWAAAKVLAQIINPEIDPDYLDEEAVDTVITFNDSGLNGRTAVLDAFEAAIRKAGGEPIVKVKKPRKRKAA